MARLIPNISETQIKRSIEDEISNNLNLSYNAIDSTINMFSESVADELIFVRRQVEDYFNSSQPSNATGGNLDRIAFEMYGLTRIPDSFASSNANERNFYFYPDQGTFGDLNSGNTIIIPEGTLISSERDTENSPIVYRITADVICNSEARQAFFSAVAINTGFAYNVDSNSLVHHNFTSYSMVNFGGLNVSNIYPILNGRDLESDVDFKFRLNNFLTSQINLNIDAITLRSLLVPGVVDVRVIPSYNGIGTTGIILFNTGKETNVNINNMVQSKINELRLPGRKLIVNQGIKVIFEFQLRVYVRTGVSELVKERVKTNLKQNIYSLIKQLENSRIIDFESMSSLIKNNFNTNDIVGFGNQSNNKNIFEKLYIRKTDRYNEYPEEREELLENFYIIREDERINFGNIDIIVDEDLR